MESCGSELEATRKPPSLFSGHTPGGKGGQAPGKTEHRLHSGQPFAQPGVDNLAYLAYLWVPYIPGGITLGSSYPAALHAASLGG